MHERTRQGYVLPSTPDRRLARPWRGPRAAIADAKRVREAVAADPEPAADAAPRRARAYRALVGRGTPAKVALAAIMRKLLATLGAMLRHRTPWREESAPAGAAPGRRQWHAETTVAEPAPPAPLPPMARLTPSCRLGRNRSGLYRRPRPPDP